MRHFERKDPLRSLVSYTLVPLSLALMALGPVSAEEIGGKLPDCQCRAPDGERRDLGTVECVTIGSRRVQVRCEMSTNTPYWRQLDSGPGCPLV